MKMQSVSETNWDAGSSYIQWHKDWQQIYSVLVDTSNTRLITLKLEIVVKF